MGNHLINHSSSWFDFVFVPKNDEHKSELLEQIPCIGFRLARARLGVLDAVYDLGIGVSVYQCISACVTGAMAGEEVFGASLG